MKQIDLADISANERQQADIIIVGSGPAGLTVARELSSSGLQIVVLESGETNQSQSAAELNAVTYSGDLAGASQRNKRQEFHGASGALWSNSSQPYGVRCRAVGGSTHAWAGKSALFDDIDFETRDWVKGSGWPIDRAEVTAYADRAAKSLNLGPNAYGTDFWSTAGRSPKAPELEPTDFQDFFWQFARSTIDPLDIYRAGDEFKKVNPKNVTVVTGATVTDVTLDPVTNQFESLTARNRNGTAVRFKARAAVLGAGSIENARLLLSLRSTHPRVPGLASPALGRYLMDHPGGRVAHVSKSAIKSYMRRFGFVGLSHEGRTHMYMHGASLSPDVQRRKKLLNTAFYCMSERAKDDPYDAIKRLVRRQSDKVVADLVSVVTGSALVFAGVGQRAFRSRYMPTTLKSVISDGVIRLNPNFVAQEFETSGVPHKVDSLAIDAICEQPPLATNQVTLSNTMDPFGVPIPHVHWDVGQQAHNTLVDAATAFADALSDAGLERPKLEDWVQTGAYEDAIIIDMAHMLGTTRMSSHPDEGVVDTDCAVHGIGNLFVAGGSVFPTSGHANPTLMISALSVRLADHLRSKFTCIPTETETQTMPKRLSGRRVLVTGASGKIGREVVHQLVADGAEVKAQYGRTEPTKQDNVEWVQHDFSSESDLKLLVEGCDAVIHLAASLSDIDAMPKVNVAATRALAEAASAAGCRYLSFASSMVVYGSPTTKVVTEETRIVDPEQSILPQYFAEPYMQEYCRTKVLGEQELASLSGDMQIDIVRPGVVVSPDEVFTSEHWGKPRKLLNLYRRTQFVSVSDVAGAMIHLMVRFFDEGRKATSEPATYNLSDHTSGRYVDLHRSAADVAPERGFHTGPHIPVIADIASDFLKYRQLQRRYHLGQFELSNSKLIGTGYKFSDPIANIIAAGPNAARDG